MQVTQDGMLLRPDDARQVGQPDRPQCRQANAEVDQPPRGIAIGRVERGQQPSRMRIRREQSHHWQRVDALAGSARRAVGEQPRAFVASGERMVHWRESHLSANAQTRFSGEARNRQAGYVHSCASTNAQAIESVRAQKRRREIVDVRKSTNAAPRFWRNPQMWISLKAQIRKTKHQLNTIDCSPIGRNRLSSWFYRENHWWRLKTHWQRQYGRSEKRAA